MIELRWMRMWRWAEEGVPVSGGKGDNSKAEMQRADQISSSQLALQKQALGMQQSHQADVDKVINPMIAQSGMSPQEEAALRSLALNQGGSNLNSSIGAINNNLVARGISGGPFAGGGGAAREYGGLYSMQNALTQQNLSQIQVQKAQQLQQLLNLKLGIGAQLGQNVGVFGQGGSNALNAGVNAANNADQASTGFWGALIGAGAGLGSAGITRAKG